MHLSTTALFLVAAISVMGSPIELDARAASCPSYTIISTRGTGEAQGPSIAFATMNRNTLSQQSGGKVYNTVYSAGFSQNSIAGTKDIINHIQSTLSGNPDECFILQGWSQGAAATVNALSKITENSFDAVKGVFLIGDPNHKAGLACNVDAHGGDTTKNVYGVSAFERSFIPEHWISKTMDVCAFGDGICDVAHGLGINIQHLSYSTLPSVQRMGTTFNVEKLSGSA